MTGAKVKLEIVVVGGGIGGLTVATFLKQDGHSVTVLEKQSENYRSRGTGGIGLFQNSQRLWQQRELLDKVLSIADFGRATRTFSHKGHEIASLKSSSGHSLVHRADLLQALSEAAVEHDVKIRYNMDIQSIKDSAKRPAVILRNGEIIEADLIIGADGVNSFIRSQCYPEVKPILQHSVVLIVNVPPEAMEQTEETADLWYDTPMHHTLGPYREVVSWPMKKHNPPGYHLQFCDHQYTNGRDGVYGKDSAGSAIISKVTDMSGFRNRWREFNPRIQHILDATTEFTRWKIAELPVMPTWSSPGGAIVLLGDAAHAVQPFAGQGANMAVEDSGCLTTLLSLIESKEQIPLALKLYNTIRIPRVTRLKHVIKANIETFGMPDGPQQERRDAALQALTAGPQIMLPQPGEPFFDTLAGMVWLIRHDVIAETNQAWTDHTSQQEQARI